MSLFQKSVINKYLKNLDTSAADKAFEQYKNTYTSAYIAQVKSLKEEEHQDGFLRDIFVNCLGYTLKPHDNFDLVRERKNETDAKKADGAIIMDDKVIAVIELKDTKTKDMGSITDQAFGYKNSHEKCKFVVTSNFHKLRFYIDNKVDFEEFDLFELNREQFDLLYLILSRDSVFSDLPSKLKSETKFHEESISNKLYKDYSVFKRKLYDNMVTNAPAVDKLTLFKKSQKLIDRFLFILFAEDRGLLPPNSISRIISRFDILKSEDAYKPLYDICRQFFGYLNTGNGKEGIPAYNGGLFLPDDILDTLKIDDEVLRDDLYRLSTYDFDTEIDVNILGHIFEHSLSEIEEITSELEGVKTDKAKSKRKKDGVYYTPKYITQYIVENTIGTLCTEKRTELGIAQIEFDEKAYRKPNGFLTDKGKILFDKLEAYKKWLLTLKIVDPACGSGAFLNQALNFLIAEHKTIDDIIAELTASPLRLFDTDKAILENNLYGVDINDESVEIAKLSLWLHTARKDRKLSDLNNNIKCGNSLINDPKVAGDKAFDWHKEFPDIMQAGGFDVVIGNPPYVRLQGLKANYEKESNYYEQNYEAATLNYDIYALFIEKAFKLINGKGNVCFIQPHKFLISDFGIGLRRYLLNNNAVESLLHFGSNMVFKDASTYTCILKLSHNNESLKSLHIEPEKIEFISDFNITSYKILTENNWNLTSADITSILDKLKKQPLTVKDVFAKIFVGLQTSGDKVYMIKSKFQDSYIEGYSEQLGKNVSIEKGLLKPILKGEDISKYKNLENQYWVIFPYLILNGKAEPMAENYIQQNFPKGYAYLKENEDFLRGRERGKMDKEGWFLYIYPKSLAEFEQEKLTTPEISLGTNITYDKGKFYHNTKAYSFIKKSNRAEDYRYFLAVLNSKLMWFFLKNTGYELRGGYFTFKTNYLNPFPLPELKKIEDQIPFVEKTQSMLDLNKQLQEKANKFHSRIKSNFVLEKISTKLESFYEHDFKTFVAELKKQKILLTLKQQDEWEEYFNGYKDLINDLQAEIKKTDAEIDQMVFKLYELTEEEIRIVEESVK